MEYNQELLFTPEGVRDIYGDECEKRENVQENIQSILKLYGFKNIQTPSFEFFDIFNQKRGTASSNEMYKFFDRDNNTLVLRPDITPSIARCVAKYYKEETLPIRLCYMGSTFSNNTSYQGRLKEICQIGAELMNDSTSDADGEMIALTIECLKKVGLIDFQVAVGHAEFFQGLVEEANLSKQEISELKNLIENKNVFGVEELLEEKKISEELKEIFISLSGFFEDSKHLNFVKSKTKNERVLNATERLKSLYEICETYGLSNYVTLDLGMLNHYNYYTGIIFKVYTYGTGEAIASGGRYDKLIEQFGKECSAIGVAIVLDQLMIALERQGIFIPLSKKDTLILYRSTNREIAIKLANQFREQGLSIRLLRKDVNRSIDEYKSYAKASSAGGILEIENEDTIHVYDVWEGTHSKQDIKQMMNR